MPLRLHHSHHPPFFSTNRHDIKPNVRPQDPEILPKLLPPYATRGHELIRDALTKG